jgi:hypothetical protein
MIETLKQKLIHWLARKLLPLVEPTDIVQFSENKGLIHTFINGNELTIQEISELKRECRLLDELRIWKIMNDYFINLAQDRMWKKAESDVDILFSKTILYVLNVQKEIKNKIEKSC